MRSQTVGTVCADHSVKGVTIGMNPGADGSAAIRSFQRVTYARSDTSGRTASTATAVSRSAVAMGASAKHRTLWPRWDRPSTTAARGDQSPPAVERPNARIFLLAAMCVRPTDAYVQTVKAAIRFSLNCPSFDTRGTGLLGDRSSGRPRLAPSLIAIRCPLIGHLFAQSPGRYEMAPWDLGQFLDRDNTDFWPFARQDPR